MKICGTLDFNVMPALMSVPALKSMWASIAVAIRSSKQATKISMKVILSRLSSMDTSPCSSCRWRFLSGTVKILMTSSAQSSLGLSIFSCGSHWGKNQLFIQKLPRIWYFKNVNFVKNAILKMWILWRMRFSKYEFVKNDIFKMWILTYLVVKLINLQFWSAT